MEVRPQDIVVLLKLLVVPDQQASTYARLGEDLFMSPSQVFRSVNRASAARLLQHPALSAKLNRENLKEFLIHGVKYAFPIERGVMTRGIPTAYAAPPLKHAIAGDLEPPPVWPYAQGTLRGLEFSPLYENVPKASLRDPKLYELLTLLDAIRDGRVRERELAIRELTARIDAA